MSAIRLALNLKARGEDIEGKFVVLKKPQQDAVQTHTSPSEATNLATLNHLKTMLTRDYDAPAVEQHMKDIFDGASMEEVETIVRENGITGDDLSELAYNLLEDRKAMVLKNIGTRGAEFHEIVRAEIMEEMNWPASLGTEEQNLVANKAMEVLDELALLSGEHVSDFKMLLTEEFAKTAAALQEKGAGAAIKPTLDREVALLKKAMDHTNAEAVTQGENIMGALARALAPKLKEDGLDFALTERRTRMDMVHTMVQKMGATPVTVTLAGKPQNVSLAEVFSHQDPVWPQLGEHDREMVIQAFKTRHAETHGYPDKVKLERNARSDAHSYSLKDGTYTLNLTRRTFESDDTRRVLKTLAHELTHAYQYSLIMDDSTLKENRPPERVIQRFKYDACNRDAISKDNNVTDFAHQQNNYARDFMERAAIESEHAVLQLMSANPPSIEELVQNTQDIHLGQAGDIRVAEWSESLRTLMGLADNTTEPIKKILYQAEGATMALELANVANHNYLKEAGELLEAIDFSGISQADRARISEQIVDDLSNLRDRIRSGDPEKTFAKQQLPKFQKVLLRSTPDETLREETRTSLLAGLRGQINQTKIPVEKVDLRMQRAELHLMEQTTPKKKIGSVNLEVRQMMGVADASKDTALLEKTIGYLSHLEAQLRPLAGNNAALNKAVDQVKNAGKALSQRLKEL